MSKPVRYSKVSRRMWGDQKIRRLTQPQPCGFTLFQRFLTGPELTNVPGLFPAWEGGLADALKWPLEAFREAFREVFREGLAEADWEAGLVWVPNAIDHNEPESPNVVESWGATLSELPECELKERAIASLFEWIKARDKASGKASDKPWEKAWRKGYTPPSRNQEQEQEQDLSDLKPRSKDLTASARSVPAAPTPVLADPVATSNDCQSAALAPVAPPPTSEATSQPPPASEARRWPILDDPFRRSLEPQGDLVQPLFEAWRDEAGKPGATLDGRGTQFWRRLAHEGVTVEEVRDAMRGAKLDDWARDTAKLAPSPILGSAEQRLKFIELGRNPPPPNGSKGPRQPTFQGGFLDELRAAVNGGAK